MKHILEKKVYDNYIDIDSYEFQEIVETIKEILYEIIDDGFEVRFYSMDMGFKFITNIEITGQEFKRFNSENVKNYIKSCIAFLGNIYDSTIIKYKNYDGYDIKIQHSNGDKLEDLDDTLDSEIYYIAIRLRTYSIDVVDDTINHFLTESISADPNYLKAKDYVENNKYFLKNLWIESLSEQENEENLIGYFMQYPEEMKSNISGDNIRLPMYNAYLNNYAPNIQKSIGTTNGLTID